MIILIDICLFVILAIMEVLPTTEEVSTTTAASFINTINQNITDVNIGDINFDNTFVKMLCSILFAMAWVIYITFYNSRVAGYFITKALNRFFVSEGYIRVGKYYTESLCIIVRIFKVEEVSAKRAKNEFLLPSKNTFT